MNSIGEGDWSDWYAFDGDGIGFQAPSDKGGVRRIADSGENPVYVGRSESLLERLTEHQRAPGSVRRVLGDTRVAHCGIWLKGRFDGSLPIQ